MTLRMAAPEDAGAIEAFLAGHAETSMFLRSNLAAHGIGERTHPHGTTFWLQDGAAGIAGVFGASNGGYLMVQAPDADAQVWQDWVRLLQGRLMRGITGDDVQVRKALAALGLRIDLFSVNQAEPLYRMELARLDGARLDGAGAEMRPATAEDREILTEWFTTYLMETGLTDDVAQAREEAGARALAAGRSGAERLLIEDGRPVATASLNAQVDGIVQVGGVFVPVAERNRGLGRTVTAARLREARRDGARMAILFSNNDAASRAYEAIGFERIGAYRLAVLKAPMFVGEPA
ncbi:MAG: hypothetical protein CML66_10975 [Rhodobacteraceae bacterium]|nr:hypothetical protein [Paracoccaceae bacterium]MAY44353.1 hypothetical protein [Paracoccaceae bacterium]